MRGWGTGNAIRGVDTKEGLRHGICPLRAGTLVSSRRRRGPERVMSVERGLQEGLRAPVLIS